MLILLRPVSVTIHSTSLPLPVAMLPLLFTIFLVLWLAFLGATVGSFLNVVVYRLPAGLSLVHPPSRCPRCEHAIRWHDNIPVLGWLWLRGRCRDCGEPITARYPLVEVATGAMFLLLAWTDGIIPLWLESFVTVRGRWQPEELLIDSAGYLLHTGAICTLWASALMQYDGHRPPARMLLTMALVLGLGSFGLSLLTFGDPPWYRLPAANVLSGLATAAFAMFSTVFWTCDAAEQREGRWTFVELAALCGLVLPLSTMIWAMSLSVGLGLVAVLVNRRANYPLLCLLGGLLIQPVAGHYYRAIAAGLLPYYRFWITPLLLSLLWILMTEASVLIRRRATGPAAPG